MPTLERGFGREAFGEAEVAERRFGGMVERNLTTAIYTARR